MVGQVFESEQCESPVECDNSSLLEEDDDAASVGSEWLDELLVDGRRESRQHTDPRARRKTNFYPSPPLGLQPSETRLLTLLPGEYEAEIRSSLWICSLDNKPRYEALSYTWGPISKDLSIYVNGHIMSVTDNLEAALRRLRYKDRQRVLWVDALCIDQHSVAERNHQVTFMSRIYRAASRVLVWLGDCDQPWSKFEPRLDYRPTVDSFVLWQAEHLIKSFKQAVEEAQPQWWTRAWTVQEFVVAREIPLLCFGEYAVELELFSKSIFKESPECTSLLDSIRNLAELKRLHNANKLDLLRALSLTSDRQAADPRDTIYSLLGLIRDISSASIQPDYAEPVASVLARATRICWWHAERPFLPPVESQGWTLSLKCTSEAVQITGTLSEVPSNWSLDLPSWKHRDKAPGADSDPARHGYADFKEHFVNYLTAVPIYLDGRAAYRWSYAAQVRISPDAGSYVCQAVILDRVVSVGKDPVEHYLEPNALALAMSKRSTQTIQEKIRATVIGPSGLTHLRGCFEAAMLTYFEHGGDHRLRSVLESIIPPDCVPQTNTLYTYHPEVRNGTKIFSTNEGRLGMTFVSVQQGDVVALMAPLPWQLMTAVLEEVRSDDGQPLYRFKTFVCMLDLDKYLLGKCEPHDVRII
ncbi:hypothetical protein LTR86_006007 [Recurvomyces mirabilis]|nr:hypothetical protein LTR86_006007 [Recurvomyces mirabilis]